MDSIILNLSSGGILRWPQFCPICGKTTTDQTKASRTALTSFNYYVIAIGWTTQTHSVSFPICHKHKILCSILDFPSTGGFVYRLFAAAGVPSALFLIFFLVDIFLIFLIDSDKIFLNNILKDDAMLLLFYITNLLSICYFFFGEFFKPIRLLDNNNNIIKIYIKNKDYKKAFMLLNGTYIVDHWNNFNPVRKITRNRLINMKILKTKISRGIFIAGIFIVFNCLHFTGLVEKGGVGFDKLIRTFNGNLLSIFFYIGIIIGIPLILSMLFPAIYKWIRSGD